MVKQIIKEAMDQNPLGLKEAVAEELRTRVALALEAKMEEMSGLEEGITTQNKKDAEAVVAYAKQNRGKGIATTSGDNRIIPNIQIVRYLESIGKVKNVKELPSGKGWSFELKESIDLGEAKMTDAEVLSAAKALAANGKDAKTKAFGKGLVDFYKKEGSFTQAQVGGLQNIMKNASFQMAKDK
jgi:hypothetical protein